jgi:hypothetical protein
LAAASQLAEAVSEQLKPSSHVGRWLKVGNRLLVVLSMLLNWVFINGKGHALIERGVPEIMTQGINKQR